MNFQRLAISIVAGVAISTALVLAKVLPLVAIGVGAAVAGLLMGYLCVREFINLKTR